MPPRVPQSQNRRQKHRVVGPVSATGIRICGALQSEGARHARCRQVLLVRAQDPAAPQLCDRKPHNASAGGVVSIGLARTGSDAACSGRADLRHQPRRPLPAEHDRLVLPTTDPRRRGAAPRPIRSPLHDLRHPYATGHKAAAYLAAGDPQRIRRGCNRPPLACVHNYSETAG